MAKKRIPKRNKPIPPFNKMPPVDPEVFITAFKFAMNAATGSAPIDDPTKMGVNLIEDDGSVSAIRFTDTPFNRALLAMKERFADDPDMFTSAAARMLALGKMLNQPELSRWLKDDDKSKELHDAILETAAVVPLKADGEFPLDKFVLKLEEITETKYKGEI